MQYKYNYRGRAVALLIFLGVAIYFSIRLSEKEKANSNASDSANSAEQKTKTDAATELAAIDASSTTPSTEGSPNAAKTNAESDAQSDAQSLVGLTEHEKEQVRALKEILRSHNDNDPRMDSQLKTLELPVKLKIQEFYSSLNAEDRNGRGTALFLLGRNLNTKEDVQFLAKVFSEKPCLSLADCSQPPAPSSEKGAEYHHDSTDAITQNYPQLVALKMLEKCLTEMEDDRTKNKPEVRESAMQAIREAQKFQNPLVQKKASELLARLNK